LEQKKSIYIADDDDNIREAITAFLDNSGFEATAFQNGDLLLQAFFEKPCDLAILDIVMPGSSGFEVCASLRKVSTVPIIMLTARDSDLDYATGITLGSDDYFTKPFSAMSLMLRVKAIFRRIEYDKAEMERAGASGSSKEASGSNNEGSGSSKEASGSNKEERVISFQGISILCKSRTVAVKGSEISLTPLEYAMLKYMMERAGAAVSRAELLDEVWHCSVEVQTSATDDTVRRLRKKLAGSDAVIEAVWGFGYRLKGRVEDR
jgi:DNA-binding response OmpR family regulator